MLLRPQQAPSPGLSSQAGSAVTALFRGAFGIADSKHMQGNPIQEIAQTVQASMAAVKAVVSQAAAVPGRMMNAALNIALDPRMTDNPIQQCAEVIVAAKNGVQAVRRKISDALHCSIPKATGARRASGVITPFLVGVAGTVGLGAKVATDIQPAKLPDMNEPIPMMMRKIETPFLLQEHLERNGIKYISVKNAADWILGFRPSIEKIHKDGGAACNGLLEYPAYWAMCRGVQSYANVVRPSNDFRSAEQWHEVLSICIRRGEAYVMFDNGTFIPWRGTLEEFRQKHYPTMTYFQKVKWTPAQDNLLSKMGMHAPWLSVEDEDMAEYPHLKHWMDIPRREPSPYELYFALELMGRHMNSQAVFSAIGSENSTTKPVGVGKN